MTYNGRAEGSSKVEQIGSDFGSSVPEGGAAGNGPLLSREFVARRFSEGESGRLKEELKCQSCGKGYKHISSLAKHLWEHTPEWNVTSKLLISKHQQVQLLEAASILVSMNEEDSHESNTNTPERKSSAEPSSIPTPPSIPLDSPRSITKSHNRRASVTATGSFGRRRLSSSAGGHHGLMLKGSPITDSLFVAEANHNVDELDALASPYQRTRRMSNLRHHDDIDDDDDDEHHENGDSPDNNGVFGDME
jgi:hypothetical protein